MLPLLACKVVQLTYHSSQARQREQSEIQNRVCNAGCAQYRKWQREGMSEEENIKNLRPWIEKRLRLAGGDRRVDEINIVDREEILVSLRTLLWEVRIA